MWHDRARALLHPPLHVAPLSLGSFFPLWFKPPTATPRATLRHRLALASELTAVGSHGRPPHPHARAIRSFSSRDPPSATAFFPFMIALLFLYPLAATEPHRDPHCPLAPPPPLDAIMPSCHYRPHVVLLPWWVPAIASRPAARFHAAGAHYTDRAATGH
jgi:hypothetical protein